jgi:hypothetical protein
MGLGRNVMAACAPKDAGREQVYNGDYFPLGVPAAGVPSGKWRGGVGNRHPDQVTVQSLFMEGCQ